MAPVTVTGFDPTEDILLAEAYDEIKREIWVLVSQRIAHKGGKVHEPEMCARRYLALYSGSRSSCGFRLRNSV
jgi:hypothetical protein